MQVQIELSIKPLQQDQVVIIQIDREQIIINSKKVVVPITSDPQVQDRHLRGLQDHLIRGLPVRQVAPEALQGDLLQDHQDHPELVNLVNSKKKL